MTRGLCAGALLGLLFAAMPAAAAEYEVRMPVEKKARITPSADAQQVKPEAQPGAKPAAKADAKPAAKADADAKAAPAEKAAPKAEPRPEPKPEPKHEPKASPRPPVAKAEAKALKPTVQPLPAAAPEALDLPPAGVLAGPAGGLPAEGAWVGEVRVEFTPESVILKVATSGAVARVTWFNVAQPDAPRKLAADLRGPWRKRGAFVLRFDTGPVKAVVVGEHPDRLRLSTEFRDGVVKRELDPLIETTPTGVTLTIPLSVRLGR